MNKKNFKKIFNFVLGMLIVSTSFNLFFFSNNLSAFGISGLSIIINKLFGIAPSTFILIANLILITISYFVLGKEYTKKTVLGGICFPLFIRLTSFIPNYIDISSCDLLAIAVVGGVLTGLGNGLIYKEDFGTAGTDITNEMIHRYFKLTMGTSILIGDGLIVILGGLVFGVERMVYSLIVLWIMTTFCNKIMLGIKTNKVFYIVTTKEEKIKKYIFEKLNTDITVLNSEGAYEQGDKKILMTVVEEKNYNILKNAINRIDKKAFVTVTESYGAYNKNVYLKNKKGLELKP